VLVGDEDRHFNVVYPTREGELAAGVGDPTFDGLGAGTAGVAFRWLTVEVKVDHPAV
jgi:hypothetical protein